MIVPSRTASLRRRERRSTVTTLSRQTVLPLGFGPAVLTLMPAPATQEMARVQIERVTNASVIGDIYSTFLTLKFRDLRLISSDLLGQNPLRHADLLSMPDKAIDNSAIELIAFRVLTGHVQPRNEVGPIGRIGLLCRIDLFC